MTYGYEFAPDLPVLVIMPKEPAFKIALPFDLLQERSICRSLFSWANDGSHSIPDDLEFSENTDAPDKYRKVFKDIFYKTHNEYHYDRMME